MVAANHLIRYVTDTRDLSLQYTKPPAGSAEQANVLWGYRDVDSDWAGCPDSRKYGYSLMLNGAAISWQSKQQSVIALSTAEAKFVAAKFVAASTMVQEVIFTRKLLEILGLSQTAPNRIYEDNTTCIAWAEGSVGGSDRAKHIDLRMHFVHEAIQNQVLVLVPIKSGENASDLLSKPLGRPLLVDLRRRLLGL